MRGRSRSVAFRSRRPSGGAGAWSPADIPDCDLAHLWYGATLYTTDGGTTVAAVDDPVGRMVAAAGPDGVQSSSSLRPTRKSDGLSLDPTDDLLSLATAVSVGSEWTAYLTGQIASGGDMWSALGSTADASAGILRFSDGNLYVLTSGSTFGAIAMGATGPFLLRLRATGGVVYAAWTGSGEQALAMTGSVGVAAWDIIGSRAGNSHSSSPANRYRDRLIYSRDLSAGERSQVEAYFAAQGYSL